MTERWRLNALGALADTKAEIDAATEPTLYVIMVVTEADLLRQRPVSFYGNIRPEMLGPMLTYCGARVSAKLADPTGKVDEVARVQHVKRGSTYRVVGRAKIQTGTPLPDDAEVMIYQGEEDGQLWVRPVDEFTDGRFRELGPEGEAA